MLQFIARFFELNGFVCVRYIKMTDYKTKK